MPNNNFKAILRWLVNLYRFIIEYLTFTRRYLKFSRTLNADNESKLLGEITATYHVIEKGLCMPNRRKVFGESVANDLLNLLDRWIAAGYSERSQFLTACRVLVIYSSVVESEVVDSLKRSSNWPEILAMSELSEAGGTISIKSRSMHRPGELSFAEVISSRRSVRMYSDKSIDKKDIIKSVNLALNSPSVCNRQSYRVHYYEDSKKISQLLGLQNGNRGFGHLAKGLLIITSDLSSFSGVNERNQCFIDGGLFSMSLMLSLTDNNLVSCPLNWCRTNNDSKRLREVGKIPNSEEIIMLMTVGCPLNKYEIAASKKLDVKDILCIQK